MAAQGFPKGSKREASRTPCIVFFNRLAPGTILGGFGEVLSMIWGGLEEGFGRTLEGFSPMKIKGELKGTKEN